MEPSDQSSVPIGSIQPKHIDMDNDLALRGKDPLSNTQQSGPWGIPRNRALLACAVVASTSSLAWAIRRL
jgi:hypothetical protein